MYENLLSDTDFTDVTLACENDKVVKAQKLILSGSSSFFRNLLLVNPRKHPLIYLKGVNMRDLQAVLQFIYLGETKVEKDMVTSFLEVARELDVEGLTKDLEENTYTDKHMEDDFKNTYLDKDLVKTVKEEKADDSQSYTKVMLEENLQKGQENAFSCNKCQFKTKHQFAMKRHISSVHDKLWAYNCDFCDKKCSQKFNLLRHNEIAHPNNLNSTV